MNILKKILLWKKMNHTERALLQEICFYRSAFENYNEKYKEFDSLLGTNNTTFSEIEVAVFKARENVRVRFFDYISAIKSFLTDLEGEIVNKKYDKIALSCRATIEEMALCHSLTHSSLDVLKNIINFSKPFNSSSPLQISKVFDIFEEANVSGRFYNDSKRKSVNILTQVNKATKREFSALRIYYDYFSELCHPNQAKVLLRMCSSKETDSSFNKESFLKDFFCVIGEILESHGRLYTQFEHVVLLMEYYFQKVVVEKKTDFVSTKLDHIGSGKNKECSKYFLFCWHPADHIRTQNIYLEKVSQNNKGNGGKTIGAKKALYIDAVFKYDKRFLKKGAVWFRIPSFAVIELLQNIQDNPKFNPSDYVVNRLKEKRIQNYFNTK